MRICGAVVGLLLAGLLAACHTGDAAGADEAAAASHVREGALVVVPEKSELRNTLAVAAVERRTAQIPLEAPAVLEADPARVANILPPLAGRISALHVHLGDTVKAGQPLFTLDSADLAQARADLQKARIGLEQTRKALDRQRDLAEHKVAAAKDVEQAQADYDNARSELQRAVTVFQVMGIVPDAAGEAARPGGSSRELTVRAPLAGRVSMLAAVPGTYANDNTAALLTVSDLSTIWFTASVPEKDLGAVQAGEAVSATVQSFPGEKFEGKVLFVADQLDADSRTAKVRAAYANPDGRLKPGMFATMVFAGQPHSALLVPLTALIQSGDSTVVFVEVQPWKFEARPVVTGQRSGEEIEVLRGLAGGERIVVRQGVLLND
ncbi:MAG TPA: efflux RND transporter periplasmic adaptor subunit [Nevskia sp.]|nr:efflux RND transporter periplasmic adaptor subunit [Nevskia sp.]